MNSGGPSQFVFEVNNLCVSIKTPSRRHTQSLAVLFPKHAPNVGNIKEGIVSVGVHMCVCIKKKKIKQLKENCFFKHRNEVFYNF